MYANITSSTVYITKIWNFNKTRSIENSTYFVAINSIFIKQLRFGNLIPDEPYYEHYHNIKILQMVALILIYWFILWLR